MSEVKKKIRSTLMRAYNTNKSSDKPHNVISVQTDAVMAAIAPLVKDKERLDEAERRMAQSHSVYERADLPVAHRIRWWNIGYTDAVTITAPTLREAIDKGMAG